MKKKYFLQKVIIILFFFTTNTVAAKTNYFDQGEKLFKKNKFAESKFFFEQDIVYNPKSEKSYLYLAKIFKEKDNDLEEEKNLESVLILNPKNDEAIYMLAILKIKSSDYKKAEELIKNFNLVCSSFCYKKNEIKEKLNKLTPENEADNN